VTLTIINTPPVAIDDVAATTEDGSVTFGVLTNDTDIENNIDPSKTISLTSPSAGILTNNHHGTFTWNPNGAFEYLAVGESATVTFDYRVIDEFDDSDVGTVTITVHGVNDAPAVGVSQSSVTINEGQMAANSGSFTDIDLTDRPTITASIGTITQDASNNGAWTWSFNSNDGPRQYWGVELCGSSCFTQELLILGLSQVSAARDFDSDDSVQFRIGRLPDFAKRSPT